jgi:hypothetical protein
MAADETISVEVRDGVDKNISRNLSEISSQARNAYQNVSKLVQQLNRVKPTAIAQFNSVVTNAEKQMSNAALSSQRLATEQQRTAAATSNAATAQQRLATATAQTERAENSAAQSAIRLESAQQRQATAAQRAADSQARATAAASAQTAKLAAQETEVSRIQGIHDRFNAVLARSPQYQKTYAAGVSEMAAKSKLAHHELVNLGYQVNDVAVSLGSGQAPLRVFLQQGAQIGQIFGASGVGAGAILRQLASIVGTLLTRLLPFAAIAAAALAPFELFTRAINKGVDSKKLVGDLDLTDKQLKKLKKSGEDLNVTFGDTFKATFQVIGKYAMQYMKPVTDWIVTWWNKALDWLTHAVSVTVRALLGAFIGFGGAVKAVWNNIPAAIELAVKTSINSTIENIETGINLIRNAIKDSPLGKLLGIDGAPEIKIPRLALSDAAKGLQDDISTAFDKGFATADKLVDKFAKDVRAQAIKNAQDRIKKAAGEDNTKGPKGFDKARELAAINAELDSQAKNMFVLATARDAVNRADEIAIRFAKEKKPLTTEEYNALKAKIQALNDAKAVQEQFDRIYNAVTGPQREYNASLTAADKLLKMGTISQAQYNAEVLRAKDAYKSATDPLYQMNKELDDQIKLLHMMPLEREIEQQVIQAINQATQAGKPIRDEEIKQLREKLQLVQQLNIAAQFEDELIRNSQANKLAGSQGQIDAMKKLLADPNAHYTQGDAANDTVSALQAMGINTAGFQTEANGFVSQWQTMYQQIDQLRQANLISEQEAAAARVQIWAKSQEASLNTASNFFGQLAVLQKSENKKIATIGKAAAIAQAMVDTYKAATSAYAAMAGIPYVGPALGAAAAAAAIAAGLANVAQIRAQPTGGGYMTGGYTGDGPVNERAGDVHRREFVMNARATSRIGVADLAALQAGAARVQRHADIASDGRASAASGGSGAAPVVVAAPPVNMRAVLVADVKSAVADHLGSPEGEQQFVVMFQKNRAALVSGG